MAMLQSSKLYGTLTSGDFAEFEVVISASVDEVSGVVPGQTLEQAGGEERGGHHQEVVHPHLLTARLLDTDSGR